MVAPRRGARVVSRQSGGQGCGAASRAGSPAHRRSTMGRGSVAFVAALAAGVIAGPAQAAPFTLGPLSTASGLSAFAPGCGGPGEANPDSVLFQNAGVETHAAVNPTNPGNVVTFWQQDRWSDGGSHGNAVG